MRKSRLHTINNVLLIAIVVINLYIIISPLLPALFFRYENHRGEREKSLQTIVHQAPNPIDREGRRLIVPSMLLDTPISEVRSVKSISNNVWRRPNTSSPDKGGNTVLAGHRFTYTNPTGVLYHLDKVKVGDEAALTWNGKRYIYKVNSVKTTEPNDKTVEAPTSDTQLTIYTCTPLWNPKHRLVVTAKLEDIL